MVCFLKQREQLLMFNQKYRGRFNRKEWLTKGDRDTSFFQRTTTECRRRNRVMKIKDVCGIWVDNQMYIAEKFITNYELRFKSAHQEKRTLPHLGLPNVISNTNSQTLIRLSDIEEIKQALFSIDSYKAPGSDGFGAGFFKQYWHIVGPDFYNCILEFFRNGKILKEINHTFITLIPKINSPSQTTHCRPISLCSTVYKTIAKVLVNRIRPLLNNIVSPYQSAFILGRSIHDNILLTHEIMHKFNRCKGKMCWATIKLDLEKAYDRIEWDFIRRCL